MLYQTGNGSYLSKNNTIKLTSHVDTSKKYCNAQVDDYRNLKRKNFKWSPPLTLKLSARTCIDSDKHKSLVGTAGFGFWNDPILMTGLRTPSLPRALWFFYCSKPSLLYLDEQQKYNGWQAMSIDANNKNFITMLPFLCMGFPLFNFTKLRDKFWPQIKKSFKGSQKLIDADFSKWHDYEIKWELNSVTFFIDGDIIHHTKDSPKGPMGLVIWIDNQYMILKPTGRFGFGNLEVPHEQSLEIKNISIEKTD